MNSDWFLYIHQVSSSLGGLFLARTDCNVDHTLLYVASLFTPQSVLPSLQSASYSYWSAVFPSSGCCFRTDQRSDSKELTCSHLHVSSQRADSPLTGSTGQEDGDDGQKGADGQQRTSARTQHSTCLKHTEHNTYSYCTALVSRTLL